jgi:hypothetical protein
VPLAFGFVALSIASAAWQGERAVILTVALSHDPVENLLSLPRIRCHAANE